jgi:hypothetical protein
LWSSRWKLYISNNSQTVTLFSTASLRLMAFKVWMLDNGWYVSIVGIGATCVVAFWHSFCQWDELNEKQKPCIELSECVPQDIDGGKGRVFLLCVKNTSANDIDQCSVRLTNIKTKTRDIPCNDALTFQPRQSVRIAISPSFTGVRNGKWNMRNMV